jgi:hypothetical protein
MASSMYLTAALILAAAQPVPAVTDPLEPARSGQLQCFTPDTSRKMCHALAGYTFGPGRAIQVRAAVLMAPTSLLIVMRTSTSADVRSGAVCGRARARDIEASTFTIAGQPVPQQMVQLASPQILSVMRSHLDQEVCSTFVPNGSTFTTQLTIDGVAHPEISETFIWVRPNEGYAVGP